MICKSYSRQEITFEIKVKLAELSHILKNKTEYTFAIFSYDLGKKTNILLRSVRCNILLPFYNCDSF